MSKIYLQVDYSEKDEAKALGAKWDYLNKKWYFEDIYDSYKFEKWLPKQAIKVEDLSDEQQEMIRLAKEGHNILVDACIGSGKTTAIQVLCNEMNDKRILYLTYNKLLKFDARSKIHQDGAMVTNYHGYAFVCLKEAGLLGSGVSQYIYTFNENIENIKPLITNKYDLLVIDEYQDINEDMAGMLSYIKDANPNIQIVAVGDMVQKVYDYTTLNIPVFMKRFLGTNHKLVKFTKSFRISSELAKKLGYAWHKKIVGVNINCSEEQMSFGEVFEFIKDNVEPSELMCLGSRAKNGGLAQLLNKLEREVPEKFNKNTVYASISDQDANISVSNKVAVFTTYDSCKGLERKYCFIFDFEASYWHMRKQNANPEILRNIFCVAASRGKEKIVFVNTTPVMTYEEDEDGPYIDYKYREVSILDIRKLREAGVINLRTKYKNSLYVSNMFDFKYAEDVRACYNLLDIKKIKMEDESEINIQNSDGLIDLSPCVGHFQESFYFKNFDFETEVKNVLKAIKKNEVEVKGITDNILKKNSDSTMKQILFLTAEETGQSRYTNQVDPCFISRREARLLYDRLSTVFTRNECVQVDMDKMQFSGKRKNINSEPFDGTLPVMIEGTCDVLKGDTVWELKFVSELKYEHFLQCAVYMVGLGMPVGRLWNVRTNEMCEITIPNRSNFMKHVVRAVTKRDLSFGEWNFLPYKEQEFTQLIS